MLFRLSDGGIIELKDDSTNLSEFFEVIRNSVSSIDLVKEYLNKSVFKKVREQLVSVLPSSLKSIQDVKNRSEIKEKLVKMSTSEQESAELCLALEDISSNFDTIFHDVIHRITFVPDRTLKYVLEFLSIPCEKRSTSMMSNLPYLLQGCPDETTLEKLVDKAFVPYVDFI
jgi:hypothetical protein